VATNKKEPNTQSTKQIDARQIHGFQDVEVPSLYTNFMGVGTTPFDVSIIFAEVDQRDGKTEAMPKIKVMMAPEQAANLAGMLTQALHQFILANGKLRSSGRMEFPGEAK
jgi:hypothetical protein